MFKTALSAANFDVPSKTSSFNTKGNINRCAKSVPLAAVPRHWRLLHLFRRRPAVLPRDPPRLTSSGGVGGESFLIKLTRFAC
jgi:hypothetical protein